MMIPGPGDGCRDRVAAQSVGATVTRDGCTTVAPMRRRLRRVDTFIHAASRFNSFAKNLDTFAFCFIEQIIPDLIGYKVAFVQLSNFLTTPY